MNREFDVCFIVVSKKDRNFFLIIQKKLCLKNDSSKKIIY